MHTPRRTLKGFRRFSPAFTWMLVAAQSASGQAPTTTPEQEPEETVVLSPFEVSASDDMGYYASNTLSGTRLNTRLRDLGASITVITPQQLADTSSVDINDVFLYESNTEGTHTYTEYGLDRGSISTGTVQMSPEVANRLRGIGTPDRAVDYFITNRNLPIDSYNVDRITINRGPNSILFGLGSAAGLVNTSPSRGTIGADTNHLEFRLGSWGDYRGSFNLNRTLIENTLAVRMAGVYHERGFERKPSHDKTRRGYISATFRPFERTTIHASFERYSSDYRRPNVNTPQDYISTWEAAGRPTFDPSTMMVRQANGTLVPIGSATANQFATLIGSLSGGGLAQHPHNTRAAFLIENDQSFMRIQRQMGNDRTGGANLMEQVATSGSPVLPSAIFTAPGISNKSLYDWDEVNILSGNYGESGANITQFNIEQQITKDFFIELAWRKEVFERFNLAAQSGNQAGIYVDVNETLLDGSTNPFFLKPYIEVWEPTGQTNFYDSETTRATAAYELDFTQRDGWLPRLLGRHNFMGLGERRELDDRGFRWREAVISTHEWAPERTANGTIIDKSTGSNFRTRHNRIYYLGDDARITHAPGGALFGQLPQAGAEFPAGVIGPTFTHTLRHFVPQQAVDGDGNPVFASNGNPVWAGRDGSTDYGVPGGRPLGQWVNEEATSAAILHNTNPAWEQTEIESYAGAVQSYLWDDRIVMTLGLRKDTRSFRRSASPIINEQGFRDDVLDSFEAFPTAWDEVSGKTRTRGIVIHPLAKWSAVPEWLQGFSFHYNESDTFQPAPTERDLFLDILPLPTGDGKDYGLSYATINNRFVVRVNWYESAQADSRSGSGLVTGRARRVENEGGWGFVDMIEREIELREPDLDLGDLNAFEIDNAVTAPYLAEISERSGLPIEWLHNTGGFNDNRTVSSEGMEISLDYNPTNNWSIKFTAGKQEAVNSKVAPQAQRWLFGDGSFENPAAGSRLDLWQNASFTRPLLENEAEVVGEQVPWWETNWAGMPTWGTTPQSWYAGVVESLLRQDIRLQGLSNPQVRKWRWSVISNYRFTEGSLKGVGVGGSMRWEDKAAIGYMGMANPLSGVVELYDVDRPIFDKAREYFDFWASYSSRIMEDRVRMRIQLNVRNALESGGLQVFAANPDGSPAGFRIQEPRSFYLTTTFDF